MSGENISDRIIVGLVGLPSSGKDTVAGYFINRGFTHISLGDLLREKLREKGVELTRPNIQAFARSERATRGPGYLIDDAVKKATDKTVISGLRTVGELEALKKYFKDKFMLIAVTAPAEIRYQRAQERGRATDHISLEEFMREENNERASSDDSFNLDQLIALADITLDNSSTKDDLWRQTEESFKTIIAK